MPAALPTTLDPPFLAPLECVVDLPFPPSVNRVWRAQRKADGMTVARSPEYRAWLRSADMQAIANGTWRHRVKMPGRFTATIELSAAMRLGDLDNRIKAVLDWAQRVELITNDKHCEEVTARWVTGATAECRLTLRSVA